MLEVGDTVRLIAVIPEFDDPVNQPVLHDVGQVVYVSTRNLQFPIEVRFWRLPDFPKVFVEAELEKLNEE